MTGQQNNPQGGTSGGGDFGKFHGVQPERDLEANWEVDLAKKLEDYLLKICSGEITGSQDDDGHSSVNFAEAALLLQGSVQVYSRKVEYLYNLVLHALEFLSQKRQQDQPDGASDQAEQSAAHAASDEDRDKFWDLDDIPVEVKTSLDNSSNRDTLVNQFVKPPANLVVLEGDCLDTSGDGSELESYLLSTNDLYQDFILLDPYDSVAVDDYLKGNVAGKGEHGTNKGSSRRKTCQSPTRHSGGTARKSSHRKNADTNVNQTPRADCDFGVDERNMGHDPSVADDFGNVDHGFDMDDRHSEPRDLDDSDDDNNDPWEPLNPHEPGNLKVRPFRKVKASRKHAVNKSSLITTLFPLARLHGTISPELTEMWEKQQNAFGKQRESKSPPLYEKLRQSLIGRGTGAANAFPSFEEDNEDYGYNDENVDFGGPDFSMPENMPMDEDLPFTNEKHWGDAEFGKNEMFNNGDPCSQASLEDLCRSHLDALLASIAENEKQTELAARVSSWKQNIEHNLEEQDSRPPFDIHEYGERILDKFSLDSGKGDVVSYGDLVEGQEKHDVARSFSALLQLVNNGDVDLDRSGLDGESVCYTNVNPFHVRLLKHDKRRVELRMPKKRVKMPLSRKRRKGDRNTSSPEKCLLANSDSDYGSAKLSSQQNHKASAKLGSVSCTPESKRRRRSRLVEPVDLQSAL
ncbi:Condensin-2 complex subunit H2 [Hibiscus syriacus]|uniref:Condensin-2 complex subunit H2 n=1 Tax=Hibiscus syriacus TaxID=106335 RepID=A0A6A2YKE9_HIBSY|nr:condensin-2 complex subunit H2-like [Hibiscus syriacus]KAE8677614.1 Condensin-2 complex subunit H2 [Hibiscus syriacus]